MNDVLRYIHTHIREQLSANHVARQFGYSKCYFCDRFKKFTGKTFVEYVRHYRVQLAGMELLAGRRVLDVAMDYGYGSESGFYKAFMKEYGCSPSEFRDQFKEGQLYYERRRACMFQLSDRCALLRQEAIGGTAYERRYNIQRNVYYALGKTEARQAGCSDIEAQGAGIVRTLRSFTPVIIPGEIIVGFHYAQHTLCAPTDTPEGRQMMYDNGISPADMRRYFDLHLPAPSFEAAVQPHTLTRVERQQQQEWAGCGGYNASNHTVLDYAQVLRKGFSGLLKEAVAWEKQNGPSPLYSSIKAICKAAGGMGKKYARAAKKLLDSNDEAYERQDLEHIIAVCSYVPYHPARTFAEAVQALWFAHIVNCWEDVVDANSLGRLDQLLLPYYTADIEKGILTKEKAFEILCCLWIKLYRVYDGQQICLGGTRPDGTSAVNELSYLMLDVTEQLNLVRCLSVRYGAATERDFLKRALEVVGHMQKGVPFFFNDDVLIPALLAKGFSQEDAYNYVQVGCVETAIPGHCCTHELSGGINLLKSVEYVLCNGRSMMYPDFETGVPTGSLDTFKNFDQFYEAVLIQIGHLLEKSCAMVKRSLDTGLRGTPKPYRSLLTEGCLQRGRDYNDGGALYEYYLVLLCGLPNLADSLAALKKFVYVERTYTLRQLYDMLQNDFPDEAIRAEYINKAAKYGNDIDEVDGIAADIMHKICDMLEILSKKYELTFYAQPFTFLWMVEHGQHSAASPDGRHKGEPIAYSCSPMFGRDFNGLTALLRSVSKLPARRTPGVTAATVEVDPLLFCDRNLDTITDILIDAGDRGLCNVQFNVVTEDALLDAQRHPERYANLAVSAVGLSLSFNLLGPEIQELVIKRTKHTFL